MCQKLHTRGDQLIRGYILCLRVYILYTRLAIRFLLRIWKLNHSTIGSWAYCYLILHYKKFSDTFLSLSLNIQNGILARPLMRL